MVVNMSKRKTIRHFMPPEGCTQNKIFLLKKKKVRPESDQTAIARKHSQQY